MYQKKRLAVFISHIFGEYQHNLSQGIIDTASKYGYDITFFHSTDGESSGSYEGELSLAGVPVYDSYDGIIFVSGTYLDRQLASMIEHTLYENTTAPILIVNPEREASDNVLLDNNSPFSEITEHFIRTHGKKNICFVGHKNAKELSKKRFYICMETMAKHDISCSEDNYFETDETDVNIDEVLTQIHDKSFDTVICYNDTLALNLILSAQEKGLRVPKDLAISGCDNLTVGQNIDPTLTTITFPTYDIGVQSVHKLVRRIEGIIDDKATIIAAKPFIGCSCGCEGRGVSNPYYAINLKKQLDSMENHVYQDIHMSLSLHECADSTDSIEAIKEYVSKIDNCSQLYICLHSNWDKPNDNLLSSPSAYEDDEYNQLDEMELFFGFQDGKILAPCTFSKKSLLPSHLLKSDNNNFVVSPLYFKSQIYGYMMIAFKDNKLNYDFHITSWQTNISRLLKRLSDNAHITYLQTELETVYFRDRRSTLLNETGYSHEVKKLKAANLMNPGNKSCELLFTWTNSSDIAIRYDEDEETLALTVIASAFKRACSEESVIARTGETEFTVFIPSLSSTREEAKEEIEAKLDHYFLQYQRLNQKDYIIEVKSIS